MEIEIGHNIAYASRQSETAFTDEDIYELPDGPEEKEEYFTTVTVPVKQKQQVQKTRFSWFRFLITLVALLGLAFGIAALVFTIAKSSNQEQLLNEADEKLLQALDKIKLLENTQDDAERKINILNETTNGLEQDVHEIQTNYKVPHCGGTGWRRIAFLDMTDESQTCPSGLANTTYPIRSCGIARRTRGGCASTTFSVGKQYSQVCGRALAYRNGHNHGFNGNNDINGSYVTGLSITYGSPRQHIWTFASGRFNGTSGDPSAMSRCPCDPGNTYGVPSFVGNHFFCESAATSKTVNSNGFFPDNPLWDGSGCEGNNNTCCLYNNPPWFTRQLPSLTTDDIEVRLCVRENFVFHYADIALNFLEIYIR